MTEQELSDFLIFKANQYENSDFLKTDPIRLIHQFTKKEDIEIAGLLISTIAWGNRKGIIKSGEKLIEIMNHSPLEFIQNYNPNEKKKYEFVHRTFNSIDLDFFFRSLKNIYTSSSLEDCFQENSTRSGMKGRIENFRNIFLSTPHQARSEKHISNPLKNSACKRINMYLRWMVRPENNGVDLGVWNSISTSELYLPLDIHTSNNARRLGLLTRKQDDWKALEELMMNLRKIDSKDPVRLDFALFGLGVFEGF